MITTAIHEMGHCFGLGHDTERRSIMHESSFFGAFAYKLEDKTEFDGLMINFINSLNQRR
jgi:predicted Zn-dependent protease